MVSDRPDFLRELARPKRTREFDSLSSFHSMVHPYPCIGFIASTILLQNRATSPA
jgi:hypothetical protein